MVAGLDRALGHTGHARGLRAAAVPQMDVDEHLAVLVREARQRLVEHLAGRHGVGEFGLAAVVRRFLGDEADGDGPVAAVRVDREVARDAVQPRLEPLVALAVQFVEGQPGAQHRLLHDVLGAMEVAGGVQARVAQEPGAVPLGRG
ncbi:putative sigma-70 region 2 domain-containing protein [Streptomyces sp. Tu6071]|nr:putative sigma-70 region 2 domain-containing protein [Streptomyces sp. Tu6071]